MRVSTSRRETQQTACSRAQRCDSVVRRTCASHLCRASPCGSSPRSRCRRGACPSVRSARRARIVRAPSRVRAPRASTTTHARVRTPPSRGCPCCLRCARARWPARASRARSSRSPRRDRRDPSGSPRSPAARGSHRGARRRARSRSCLASSSFLRVACTTASARERGAPRDDRAHAVQHERVRDARVVLAVGLLAQRGGSRELLARLVELALAQVEDAGGEREVAGEGLVPEHRALARDADEPDQRACTRAGIATLLGLEVCLRQRLLKTG